MSCRFWVTSPTTAAPAVVARPRISSHGSSVGHGRSGRATLTRTAFSLATENSLRWWSNALLMGASSEWGLTYFRGGRPLAGSTRNRENVRRLRRRARREGRCTPRVPSATPRAASRKRRGPPGGWTSRAGRGFGGGRAGPQVLVAAARQERHLRQRHVLTLGRGEHRLHLDLVRLAVRVQLERRP